jgi:transcriptional regulator with PAS, ATPase and Fis domain
MKINRRDFLLTSASAAALAGLLTRDAEPASAQTRRPAPRPKPFSAEGRKVSVYTTAEKTDYRLTGTDTLTFKPYGQPPETQVCVFVDPSKTYQTLLGIGGAITDASAETFAKVPADKQREILEAYFDPRKGIGYTFARTNIHSCDFSSGSYTYVAEGDKEFIAGPSKSTREVLDLVRKVAKLSATVLILGESGTGKELLARLLHRESVNAEAPFIAVNVAAIPRELVESTLFGHEKGSFTGALQQRIGKFELANGGTLFLDEIGDLKSDLQSKLLRAIQEGEVERVGGSRPIRTEFRLIAATNVDLERAVKEGTFREDLFYRINVIPVRLPPLRERIEDLPVLADFFIKRYSARFHKDVRGIAESTLEMLSHYRWPGNIRELENLIERLVAVVDHEFITDEDLPFEFHVEELERTKSDTSLLDRALVGFERNYLMRALERNAWNVTQTARYLGVPLSTLKFKMERLEIRELARKIKK